MNLKLTSRTFASLARGQITTSQNIVVKKIQLGQQNYLSRSWQMESATCEFTCMTGLLMGGSQPKPYSMVASLKRMEFSISSVGLLSWTYRFNVTYCVKGILPCDAQDQAVMISFCGSSKHRLSHCKQTTGTVPGMDFGQHVMNTVILMYSVNDVIKSFVDHTT